MTQRWQGPGDVTNVPKASTIADSYYVNSSANYFNGSYIRLKNVALDYKLPGNWIKKIRAQGLNLYLKGQNLLTFYDRNGAFLDPESGGYTGPAGLNIPPVKTLVIGMDLTF